MERLPGGLSPVTTVSGLSDLAQDPAERFDLVRPDGSPAGRTKRRADVHRDGDWHRSVHVWVCGLDDDGAPFLLFQRRGLTKDTWPGGLDATVGGHYRAGEGLDDALREVDEEIGLTVAQRDLRRLGVRLCVNESEVGIRDHELQDVFLLRDDRPLTGYRLHPVELAALVCLPIVPLLNLFAGGQAHVTAQAFAPGDDAVTSLTITSADFIPSIDRYFYRVGIAAVAALRGDRHIAV